MLSRHDCCLHRISDMLSHCSKFPLSIILVGVGDGPWDMMKEFGDNIPARPFDNFQFVNFTEIVSKNADRSQKEAEFALAALMDIPSQYKATIELNILGNQEGKSPQRFPIPPPVVSSRSHPTSFRPSSPPYIIESTFVSSAPPASRYAYDNQVCPICLTDPKDMTYGCGHQTCSECGKDLKKCPICRIPISTRIKLSPLPCLESTSVKSAPPALTSTHANEVCPICLTSPKDMAFCCGHQTCCECGRKIKMCPICRAQISTRIKLY
ncbi:43kDa postsynaptic protein [Trema orientale]|uniref:43kDa postsynaptic protein n=1 Tax=Trema orientale TaxID=63057 RepID=A0A2P5ACH0_TREOI|nr:43kDa postsynaptic protein [Trema orientale]